MDKLSLTNLLTKYKDQVPQDYGECVEKQYPVSAVIDIIRELKSVDAIKFAEWLSTNQWVKRTRTHPNKIGKYYSDIYCEYKTIEELFNLFLNEN